MTSGSAATEPSAATTNADGSTSDAVAWDAGEKPAIEYGLNPTIRPADPSNPMTTVPAGGGELGSEVGPVGAIGSGNPGGVQAEIARPSNTTATVGRRPRRHRGCRTASHYGSTGPVGARSHTAATLFRERVFARSLAVSTTLRI